MTSEENKALVLQYIHIYKHPEPANEILAPDFVDHSHPEFRPGPEDLIQNLLEFHRGFPDASISIEEMIAEGDIVAFRFVVRGTHTGLFSNIPPTGKKIELTGMDFVRIANGKLAELWSDQDTLGMLHQLGVIRFEMDQNPSQETV